MALYNPSKCHPEKEPLTKETTPVDHNSKPIRRELTSIEMNPLPRRQKTNKTCNLLNFWEQRKFEEFFDEANKEGSKLDKVYGDNLSILEKVTKSTGNEVYLKALIDAGVNVDQKNLKTGEVALHYAAEKAKFESVRILLEAKADPNIQNFVGDTPLHKLILNHYGATYEKTLQLFLGETNIAVNVANLRGRTPIYIAAEQGDDIAMVNLLNLGNALDLDSFQCLTQKMTAREVISKNFPGLESNLPAEWRPDPSKGERDYKYRLFYYLLSDNETKFFHLLKEASELSVNKNINKPVDGRNYTYLQCAAQYGHTKACRELIKCGANVNLANSGTDSPITLAANGKTMLSLIRKTGIDMKPDGETLLHKTVKLNDITDTKIKILRHILGATKENDRYKNYINFTDNEGRTPLHLAASVANEKVIFFLIDNGAKLDQLNNDGEMPLEQISLPTLKKYFDNKITTNNKKHNDTNFCYKFDYTFFKFYNNTTDLLTHIRNSRELRTLLVHPIFSTAILFKWYRVRLYFYLNLFFFTLFGLSLTFSIFYSPILLKSTCNTTEGNPEISSVCYNQNRFLSMQSLVLFFATVLAASEFYQFCSSPKQYFISFENWIQIGVFVSIFTLVGTNCLRNSDANSYCKDISAIAIFFAWFEFFFVIGQHPKTTSYIDMFRTAAVFLLKFLAVHICLILAFVFSFYVIFQDPKSEKKSFSTIPSALYTTIIMITGDRDLGIPLQDWPYTAYFLFYSFIFLVATVLFNLITGFAVSATKPIQKDPFLYSCIGQVAVISFFENVFFNDSHCLVTLLHKIFNFSLKPMDVFQSHPNLFIYPNKRNRIQDQEETDIEGGKKTILKYPITNEIVEHTKRMINHKMDEANLKFDEFQDIKNHVEATLDEQLKIICSLAELVERMEKLNVTEAVENSVFMKKKEKSEAVKNKLKLLKRPGSLPNKFSDDKYS